MNYDQSKIKNDRGNRSAFTLVELLMVIAIITVLSTLAVGVIGSASNDAKAAATRARVQMIERILQTQLEEYEVRRLPFRGNILNLTNFIIANGSGSARWANTGTDGQLLVHFKNLNRMFMADLVRCEIPNGRSDGPFGPDPADPKTLGVFPSPALDAYLQAVLGVPASNPDLNAIRTYSQSGGIARWRNWARDLNIPSASPAGRDNEQRAADAAELLHHYLLQIDFNGTTALDALGNSAVGDSDGDGQLEVVDAWGGPIYFQFHQPNIIRTDTTPPTSGVWSFTEDMTDLEITLWDNPYSNATSIVHETIKPVRVDQLRPVVSSTKLLEIDGDLIDYFPL